MKDVYFFQERDDINKFPTFIFGQLVLYCFFFKIETNIHCVKKKMGVTEGWDPINLFNPSPCLCLSQARIWIFNVCRGLFWIQLRWEAIVHFVDIGKIDDHYCLNFFFYNWHYFIIIILWLPISPVYYDCFSPTNKTRTTTTATTIRNVNTAHVRRRRLLFRLLANVCLINLS
jgi:hypothetical protein